MRRNEPTLSNQAVAGLTRLLYFEATAGWRDTGRDWLVEIVDNPLHELLEDSVRDHCRRTLLLTPQAVIERLPERSRHEVWCAWLHELVQAQANSIVWGLRG